MMEGITINNQVLNNGGAVGIRVGLDANRTLVQYPGLTYYSTDTAQIWYYNGTSWILLSGTGGSLPPLAQYHIYVGNATNTPVDAGNIAFFDNAIFEVDLGDWSGAANNTYFLIRDDLKKMWAHVGPQDFGWKVDASGTNRIAIFGAWGAAGTNESKFVIYDDGKLMETLFKTSGVNYVAGLQFDAFSYLYKYGGISAAGTNQTQIIIDDQNKRIAIGTAPTINDDTYLEIFNDTSALIRTHSKSIDFGLLVDGLGRRTFIGDYDNQANGYNFGIDDVNGYLIANGVNFISGTSGGASGSHLVIYINGSQYKIQLLNP